MSQETEPFCPKLKSFLYFSGRGGRGGALGAKNQNNKGKKSDLKKFLTFLKKMFFSHFWMTADQTVK